MTATRTIRVSLFVLIPAVLFELGLYAQVAQKALENLQKRPQISISTSQRRYDVTAALDVYVRIVNLTDDDVFLKDVRINLPGDFVAARGAPLDSNLTNYHPSSDEQLAPGNERFLSFPVPHQSVNWATPIRNRQLLTFLPAEYDLTTTVKYLIPTQRETEILETTKIRFEPPLSSVVWGGCLGAILLGVFLGTYRYRNSGSLNLWKVARQTLIIVVGGAVCAAIALVLLYRVKELALPINLTVTDFYGGIVLGLFSYKIADYLYGQLFGDNPPKPANATVKLQNN